MNEIKQFFGKNLKRLRLKHGYTQEKLAEKIGINQRQLTRIETGRSFPSFATLDSICNILEISAIELFDFGNYCEICKTGTDDAVYYIANKTESNVITLREKPLVQDTYGIIPEQPQEDNLEISDEQQMFRIAKNLSRPIYVEYFNGKEFLKKVTYNPDGTSSIEIGSNKNASILNDIIDRLNAIKPSLAKLKFIRLAIQCLEDRTAIERMHIMLEGMAL